MSASLSITYVSTVATVSLPANSPDSSFQNSYISPHTLFFMLVSQNNTNQSPVVAPPNIYVSCSKFSSVKTYAFLPITTFKIRKKLKIKSRDLSSFISIDSRNDFGYINLFIKSI